MNKRLLLKLIVQPIWVEIDVDQAATELVSQPIAIRPAELMQYTTELLAFADKLKRGEMDALNTVPDDIHAAPMGG